jgi:hypothetical protein
LFQTVPFLPSRALKTAAFFEVTVCLILFSWSYFAAMCMDPGFLPYDWVTSQRSLYSWEEQLDGLAIRPDQIDFARSHKPPFASFSKQSGRFVIRGDHICDWVANWIGKRNYKQFALLIIWGMISIVSLVIWSLVKEGSDGPRAVSEIIAYMIEAVFSLLFLFVGSQVCVDVCNDQTQIQRWDGREGAGGCKQGCREVCGGGPACLWCIPTPAFGEDPFE